MKFLEESNAYLDCANDDINCSVTIDFISGSPFFLQKVSFCVIIWAYL